MNSKETANSGDVRDAGSVLGSGRSPGEGHGNPLQYTCQGNSMDRRAWQTTVLGVAEDRTGLSNFTFTFMHWRRKWQPTLVFVLENPRNRGAWWAAIYGVAQSRTRL